jgi:cation transport protein ChaC
MTPPLRLTAAHVAQVPPYLGPPQPFDLAGEVATEADHQALFDQLMRSAPKQVWVFAYGSLIWNPGFEPAETRNGHLRGWHRQFCLGWMTIFRGCPERPGIMLALDRGGSCQGVAQRLGPARLEADMLSILRREVPLRRSAYQPRWSPVSTPDGPITALIFPIDRSADNYLQGQSEDAVAHSLATSAGDRGTMAEYLLNTVQNLQNLGIHDRYLWRLQSAVADKIERALPANKEIP